MVTDAERARGMTLIEVVIAITVIAVCVTAVIGLLSSMAVRSTRSMISAQSTAIASAYLEEILSKPFAAPGVNPPGRQNFDDVRDYNNLVDNGARDHTDTPIAGLGQYRVQVFVATVQIGAPPNNVQARRVDVRVTGPDNSTVRLLGYRANYAAQVLR